MSTTSAIELLERRRLLSDATNVTVEAGMHRLLQFDLVAARVYETNAASSYATKTVWLLNQNYVVFNNNSRDDNTIAGTAEDDSVVARADESGGVIVRVNGID